MMNSGASDHGSKGRPILFAIAKEKPKEKDHMLLDPKVNVAAQAPFVDPLDSRMSLF